jgi:PadR family transcriptional regulator PadR
MESRKRNGGRPVDYISDLLRGSTDSLLLALVGESPKYGYSIIKEIEKRTEGEIRFKEGTLYPALHRLEGDGLIKGEWVSVKGMERRYYSLTERGGEVLQNRRRQWQQFSNAVDRIISPKIPDATVR